MKTRLLYLAGDTESSECPLFATQLKQEAGWPQTYTLTHSSRNLYHSIFNQKIKKERTTTFDKVLSTLCKMGVSACHLLLGHHANQSWDFSLRTPVYLYNTQRHICRNAGANLTVL